MLNLPSISASSLKKLSRLTLSAGMLLLLNGCQTMPWSETSSSANLTPPPDKLPKSADTPIATQKANIEQNNNLIDEPDVIWNRLISGFSLQKPMNKRVKREYDKYRKHPAYLARVQKRAEPYLYYILNEAEKRQLPTELVLLPIVESAFKPFAYSHGRASGLWQFIPSTGRMYGLHQNWWYDGRRDVVASTNAALDYLTALSKKFNGDWELALAAYNAGAGNVRKAIRRNKQQNKPTDFWSLKLPKETQAYVPRLLAISKIFQDADKLGIALQPIEDKPQIAIVKMDTQIDLAKAAEMAGISIEDIYRLNPAFNRWATAPEQTYNLLLPIKHKQQFELQLASLDKSELVQWQRYQIKKGDSLSQIAQQFRTSTKTLKDVNNLSSSRIRAGKHLLIPVASQNPDSYVLSAQQRQKNRGNLPRSGKRVIHTVRAGDTLWDIARLHNLSYKKIAKWNGLAPGDTLKLGQKLTLWLKPVKDQALIEFTNAPIQTTSNIRYTIRKGDSLSQIASKFNVSVNDLKKWNALNKKYIQPGQTLRLKLDVTKQM